MRVFEDWPTIADAIARETGMDFHVTRATPVAGGSINAAYRLDGGDVSYFVKLNDASRLEMFIAEAEGLSELAASRAIRVPKPILHGANGRHAWLVCECIPFGQPKPGSERLLGEQLAAMHRHLAERFGWHRDNTIGATPQRNTQEDDWLTFWRKHRLEFQMRLLERRGMGGGLSEMIAELCESLPAFFPGYSPKPSLLHGDLWSGNRAFDREGRPVIFDPAVYYGDREADLAMTELFGAFGRDFYAAYQSAWPLDAGYSVRKTLYNLYHIINHANLFGGGYLAQAKDMAARLLAEIR